MSNGDAFEILWEDMKEMVTHNVAVVSEDIHFTHWARSMCQKPRIDAIFVELVSIQQNLSRNKMKNDEKFRKRRRIKGRKDAWNQSIDSSLRMIRMWLFQTIYWR